MARPRGRGPASASLETNGTADDGAATDPPVADAPVATPADAAGIGEKIVRIARIGSEPDGGVSRLAFTRAEREAHELVGGWLRDLGLDVRTDAIGNTIATLAGAGSGPAVGVGSHLDSVYHGGRFDGIVGVVGAVELVRLLVADGTRLERPLRVVIFAGEEGARFGEPCIGSKAVAGDLTGRDLSRIRDAEGVSLAAAMRLVGLDPTAVADATWRSADWTAFLELHIEQARTLEVEGTPIGLVDVVSGSTRLRLVLAGRADHSGGTPMAMREDALVAASEIVLTAEALATDAHNRGARLTVGRLDVHPNSITTIPGRVSLTVDIRDVDSDRQRQLAVEVARRARAIAERRKVGATVEVIADTSPVVLPIWIRGVTSSVCAELGYAYKVMTSGAGHDAQIVNAVTPAGMVFVPSRAGLSHVPGEWTSASDIARGVEVLRRSVVRLDALLASLETTSVDDLG